MHNGVKNHITVKFFDSENSGISNFRRNFHNEIFGRLFLLNILKFEVIFEILESEESVHFIIKQTFFELILFVFQEAQNYVSIKPQLPKIPRLVYITWFWKSSLLPLTIIRESWKNPKPGTERVFREDPECSIASICICFCALDFSRKTRSVTVPKIHGCGLSWFSNCCFKVSLWLAQSAV